MKSEASELSKNEKNIKHRILSWCGEHKMKLAIIGLLLLGTILGCHLSEEQSFSIDTTISPSDVLIGEEMELIVKIKPLERVDGDFQIELDPESFSHIFMKKTEEGDEQLDCDYERKTCTYEIKDISLESKEDRPYKFYVTARCDSTEAKWYIHVHIRYKPEWSEEYIEEYDQKVYFTVRKEKGSWCPISFLSVAVFCGIVLKKTKEGEGT